MQKLGDLNAAEQLHIRALDDCERVLGPEHQRSIGTLHNFASFLASKGDRERAIAKYRLAFRASRRMPWRGSSVDEAVQEKTRRIPALQ